MGTTFADQLWVAAVGLSTQEQIEMFRSGILFGTRLMLELLDPLAEENKALSPFLMAAQTNTN